MGKYEEYRAGAMDVCYLQACHLPNKDTGLAYAYFTTPGVVLQDSAPFHSPILPHVAVASDHHHHHIPSARLPSRSRPHVSPSPSPETLPWVFHSLLSPPGRHHYVTLVRYHRLRLLLLHYRYQALATSDSHPDDHCLFFYRRLRPSRRLSRLSFLD